MNLDFPKAKKTRKKLLFFCFFSLFFFLLFFPVSFSFFQKDGGVSTLIKTLQAAPIFESLDLFTKILHLVKQNYVEEVDSKKLVEGAIKGMLASLDPHSMYLPADQYKEMQVDTTGKFDGLGIEITLIDGVLTVVTPIEDTPAFNAGIEPGDRILIIEDKNKKIKKETKGMSLSESVNLMRGERGSKIILHIQRKDSEKIEPIEVTRNIIKVVSVKGGLLEKEYAWLRITSFQHNTSVELKKKIQQLNLESKKNLKGLVLDLRSNPGGLLEEAVSTAGLFLDRVPIVYTVGREKNKKEIEYSQGNGPFRHLKVLVLVNEATASASEIVAGALQDHKRSLIAGKTTFGKGSVQIVLDLANQSGLKLTIARYYTPNGRSIQSKGIVPDLEIERLNMAVIEKIRKTKVLRESDLDGHILGENEKIGDKKSKEEILSSLEEDGNSATTEKEKITSSSTKEGSDTNTNYKEEKLTIRDRDRRPVRTKAGKKIRIDDPKELLKTDYQLFQALAYLKASTLFGVTPSSSVSSQPQPSSISSGPSIVPAPGKVESVINTEEKDRESGEIN